MATTGRDHRHADDASGGAAEGRIPVGLVTNQHPTKLVAGRRVEGGEGDQTSLCSPGLFTSCSSAHVALRVGVAVVGVGLAAWDQETRGVA